MSNRTLLFLVGIFLAALLVLFGINLIQMVETEAPETYVSYNHVRGAAIFHRGVPYTLNFQQQTEMVTIFNQAKPHSGSQNVDTPPAIEEVILYRFENQPDIKITPLGYIGDNLLFSSPLWDPNTPLIEQSGGKLKTLFSTTYDPS